MTRYDVIKTMGTLFVKGDVINTDNEEIYVGLENLCSTKFLLDEGYIEEIKDKQFKVGQKIKYNNGAAEYFGTVDLLRKGDNKFEYKIGGVWCLESEVFELNDYELSTYF